MSGLWSDHFQAAGKRPERFSPCKTKGTWSEIFPSAEKPPSPAAMPSLPLGLFQRCLLCRTCNASCRLLTSSTPQNPNRQFYKCSSLDHKFFKWADEVKPHEFIDVPYCGGCSAGVCRVRKEKSGTNAGRILFMCRVKEGEGSCGYRVWQDELQSSTLGLADERLTSTPSPTINGDHTRFTNNDLVKENKQINEKADQESPNIDTSQHFKTCHGVSSRKMAHLKCQENQHDESPRSAQRILDERVTSFQSPSPTVNSNHIKVANNDLVEKNSQSSGRVDNESHVIDISQQLNCHGVTSRRARRLSDVRVTLFQSPTVNSDQTEPANTELVEVNNRSNQREGNESPVVETLQHLNSLGVTYRKTDQLEFQENQPNESSSRRPHKRSRHGDVKASCSLISSESLVVSPALNSVTVEHCWMVAAIRQNLSSQLQGWWGRLAFGPMPCLVTNALKSLDGYISPQNSTFTVQDKILANSCDLTTLTRILLGVESYNQPLLNPCHSTQLLDPKPFHVPLDSSSSSHPPIDTSIPNIMSKSISKAFTQAAEHLQNDFLSILDKIDVRDYEAMSQAAEATFAALDRLFFNYQDFKGRTKEYIHCANSLAEIERSMPGNESYQKLIEHCSSERMRLDEINSVHAKAVDSVNNNKERLKSLQEEVSSTMDWLFQIEAELSCCEVEMRNMERELRKVSKNKEDLEEKYMIAANELERSKKFLEEKEAEHGVAKAAFERAKELLRG